MKANACTDCASKATNDTRVSIPELDDIPKHARVEENKVLRDP